jgi:limonene-1,2-epoxide hydrolase
MAARPNYLFNNFTRMKTELTPRQVVEKWLEAFNGADTAMLKSLYVLNAVNHQMPNEPIYGRQAIGQMFRDEFAAAPEMHCIPVQIIEEGTWAVLEWRDPKGFSGCGFFEIRDGHIQTQRGYWDRLTFNKLYGV